MKLNLTIRKSRKPDNLKQWQHCCQACSIRTGVGLRISLQPPPTPTPPTPQPSPLSYLSHHLLGP